MSRAYVVRSQDNGLPQTAFRSPDGSYVLVAYNPDVLAGGCEVEWI